MSVSVGVFEVLLNVEFDARVFDLGKQWHLLINLVAEEAPAVVEHLIVILEAMWLRPHM